MSELAMSVVCVNYCCSIHALTNSIFHNASCSCVLPCVNVSYVTASLFASIYSMCNCPPTHASMYSTRWIQTSRLFNATLYIHTLLQAPLVDKLPYPYNDEIKGISTTLAIPLSRSYFMVDYTAQYVYILLLKWKWIWLDIIWVGRYIFTS